LIKTVFLEKNGPTQAKDILFVGDEGIRELPLSKRIQIVVINDSFLEDSHKLVDAIYKFLHS